MLLLGIGSPTHHLQPECWYAWSRVPNEYAGFKYVGVSGLWTYQWPLAWFDLRDRRVRISELELRVDVRGELRVGMPEEPLRLGERDPGDARGTGRRSTVLRPLSPGPFRDHGRDG